MWEAVWQPCLPRQFTGETLRLGLAVIDTGFMIIVLMGVSGSGKSTVGRLLAARLGWSFFEGDDFHTPANIDKMSRGVPLSDEDRLPWLARIKSEVDSYCENGLDAVWACSALREQYRTFLADGIADIRFIYMKGDREVIRERIDGRQGHYMKAQMLDSQLASLEEPDAVMVTDIRNSPQEIVSGITRELSLGKTEQ